VSVGAARISREAPTPVTIPNTRLAMTVPKPGCGKSPAHVVVEVMLGLGTAGFVLPSALAGPPFRTDDPVSVDYAHREI
jgi:hypothetical protein